MVDDISVRRSRRGADALLVVGFLLALCLPVASMFFAPKENSKGKAGSPALPPAVEWSRSGLEAYPGRFEGYFRESFGLRRKLIEWHGLMQLRWLGADSLGLVTIGRDGWLFFRGNDSVAYYRGTLPPLSVEELERWRRLYQWRHDWLASQGIEYLVVFVPNKSSIYPGNLPKGLTRVRDESRLDQIIAYFEVHAEFDYIDLRPALTEHSRHEVTFFETDSHWNHTGGFVAYYTIMNRLSDALPALRPRPLGDFQRKATKRMGGDLARLLGIEEAIRERTHRLTHPPPHFAKRIRDPQRFAYIDWSSAFKPIAFEASPSRGLPTLMLIGDSFGIELNHFLREHFDRSIFVWHFFNEVMIRQVAPSVVVDQVVERYLTIELPEDPEGLEDLYAPIKARPIQLHPTR